MLKMRKNIYETLHGGPGNIVPQQSTQYIVGPY